jgi:hypothetical protein
MEIFFRAQIRHRVARGNVVLEVVTAQDTRLLCCPLFALKKFSGGMGDEDDDQVEADEQVMLFR